MINLLNLGCVLSYLYGNEVGVAWYNIKFTACLPLFQGKHITKTISWKCLYTFAFFLYGDNLILSGLATVIDVV